MSEIHWIIQNLPINLLRQFSMLLKSLPIITFTSSCIRLSQASKFRLMSAFPPKIDYVEFYKSDVSSYPTVSTKDPLCKVIGYLHLGFAVSNKNSSIEYYTKIGFDVIEVTKSDSVTIMRNKGGLNIHMFTCDKTVEDNKNVLMDDNTKKYPGHTHASFSVPNVEATQSYLLSQGLLISGERKIKDKLYAIFSRDPDRSVLEFERNDGNSDDVTIERHMIGFPQKIDHIGIRVTEPNNRLLFYAEKLGFNRLVKHYEVNSDPLKNGPPWITRTETHCDINFIVNANVKVENNGNLLYENNTVLPGIVYAGFQIEGNITDAYSKLKGAGVSVYTEEEVSTGQITKLEWLKDRYVPCGGNSIFMEDDDGNLLQLVAADSI